MRAIGVGFGVALLLIFPAAARAQRGGHMVASRPVSFAHHPISTAPIVLRAPASSFAPRRVAGTNTSVLSSSGSVLTNDGSTISIQQLLDPVPSPGFSFDHLFAIDRELGIRALIDPVTQLRLAQAEQLLRLTPATGALFPFFGGESPVVFVQSPPPVVILQQAAPAAAEIPAPIEEAQPTQDATPATAPLPDLEQFILVRRDGTQIDAIGFTRQGDRIIYITTDGRRHTLALSDLDQDETVRLNEERGTSLQLPL